MACLLAAGPAAAGDAFDRIYASIAAASVGGLPPSGDLRERCAGDPLCGARQLARWLGPAARLEQVEHPDTDSIRWVRTRPSVRVHRGAGVMRVEIRRFGRKVLRELEAALAASEPSERPPLVVDLRANQGGSFGRMLDVAGFFIGTRPRALWLAEGDRLVPLSLRGAGHVAIQAVQVGAGTASAAEVLAALLAAHGGARICGQERTAGEAKVKSVVPVDHDWRLVVERARVVVPSIDLEAGLQPSSACS